MWGKHFASMYEGSMRGAGPEFFSVWGYVISHMVPNRNHGTTVDINPGIIAFLIGMDEEVVAGKIAAMCEPDPKSRTKDEDGKKLVKISEYTYRVVNGDTYRRIRNEQDRREYQRIKQAEYRSKKKGKPALPPAGEARVSKKEKERQADADARERRYVQAVERGDENTADAIAAEGLEEPIEKIKETNSGNAAPEGFPDAE